MLTIDELKSRAPAAFVTRPAAMMSERYGFVRTADLLPEFANNGWVPVSAQQDRPTKRDVNYVRHAIVLRPEQGDNLPVVGEQVPQIMLINSHNGRTKLRMMGGLYRFICSNGLVVGETRFAAELAHKQSLSSAVGQYVDSLMSNLGNLNNTIELWKKTELSEETALDFARKAIKLRFNESAGAYKPEEFLVAKREEDDGRDLWRTFNKVQERTVTGGMHGINSAGRALQSRALTGIGQSLTFNQRLWSLAAEYAS